MYSTYKATYSIMHSYVAEFPTILDSLYQHHKHLYRVVGAISGGLQQSSAIFKVKWPRLRPHWHKMSQNIAKSMVYVYISSTS